MATPKFMKKMAILAAIETTVGTPVVPIAANAIEVFDVTLTPIEGDEVSSNVIKPYFGASETMLVTLYRKISFSVQLAGVATAGTVPGYATLLRACALSATNTPGISTVFAPVTDSIESITIYAVIDKVLYKMAGVRGNVKAQVDAKGIPKWQFEFTGAFFPALDQGSMPAVNYSVFAKPLGVNKTNTTLTVDGFAVAASSFSLDVGNTVVKEDLTDVDTTEITGRATKGSVTFRMTDVATKDWIAMGQAGVKVPVVLTQGLGATNKVVFSVPLAQLGKPSFADQNGIQMITFPYSAIPSDAGNDEFTITV
jgi:hypothetical protein